MRHLLITVGLLGLLGGMAHLYVFGRGGPEPFFVGFDVPIIIGSFVSLAVGLATVDIVAAIKERNR